MTANYSEAIDAMFSRFYTDWLSGTTAIVGTVPEVFWQGVELPEKPIVDEFWCMVSTQTVMSEQATFRNNIKRYTTSGLLVVQLFCPRSDSQSMQKGRELAELVQTTFRSGETANGVWFRKVRINELPAEENSYRFNVVVEYEFDEIA